MAPPLRPSRPCKNCGVPVDRYRSQSGTLIHPLYCAACRPRFRHKGKADHWHWTGGERSVTKSGYVRVYIAPGKRDLEHRVVWKAANGPIPRGMHVHHLNGVKTDNRIENLHLASNIDHQAIHRPERILGERWSLEYLACRGCGSTERPHQARGFCKRCHDRLYYDATHAKRRYARKADHPEWSYLYDACVACGTTERPHRSRGMCGACYQKFLRAQ